MELNGESSGIVKLDGYMIIDQSARKMSLAELRQNMDNLPWASREPYIEINDLEKQQTFISQFPAKLAKDSVVQLVEIHCPGYGQVFQVEINQAIDNYLREDLIDGSNNSAPDHWVRLRLPALASQYKFYKRLKKAGWPITDQLLQQASLRDESNRM